MQKKCNDIFKKVNVQKRKKFMKKKLHEIHV